MGGEKGKQRHRAANQSRIGSEPSSKPYRTRLALNLYIFDGAPHSSVETQKACQAADMVVIPTSEGLDDLEPSVVLANNLLQEGISASKIAFALCITSDSEREIAGAREYLSKTPYTILAGEIPFRSAFKTSMTRAKRSPKHHSQRFENVPTRWLRALLMR